VRPPRGGERTIGSVRATPIARVGSVLVAMAVSPCVAPASAAPLHVLDRDGQVSMREDRFLPAADRAPRTAASPSAPAARGGATSGRAAAARRTVRGELARLLADGAIDQPTHDRHLGTWDDAQQTLKRLSGRRFRELKAVLANVDAVAAGGGLTPGRLTTAFETVARNRQWWTSGTLLGYGQRVGFAGSRLVWQSYPGQGLQIQWLGTFGKANGLFLSGDHDPELRELLDEVVPHAAPRAGGLAWESWFWFDGGRPPWASALGQGTAIQALSRGAVRLSNPAYFDTARAALGIFRTAPPQGVRVDRPAGPHYLIYSFAPRLRVLNAFVQALNGLHDFAALANDDEGRALFATGEAELRAEIPGYDTGAWSMYSGSRESDLGYHKLVRDFLRNLCGRLQDDGVRAAQAPQAGGAAPAPTAVPDPALYCDTADRFSGYLRQAPAIALQAVRPATPRARRSVTVPYTLSKVSIVTTRVTSSGRFVAGRTVRLGRGTRALTFTPRVPGAYAISIRAVDLAGNAAAVTGAVRVRAARPRT